MNSVELWKFLAGLGFFIFGMGQLETILKSSSSRSLKLFLKRNTKSLFKSIVGGALVTGIVQSSSVVSLIVLAFVESGIIKFRNALGVILGTNLGTTLSSWIVATIGFKIDVLNYALPVIAISAIGMFATDKRKKLLSLFTLFFALGILFLGLSFMKEGALYMVKEFDIGNYAHLGTIVFVLIGFVLTTIIQSSSATVAITLTAIYSGVLTFPMAAAVVIGSEVGTTIKILLWGMKGSADKKRVAFANFIYNILTAIFAYFTLVLIVYFITDIVKINDPLIALVFFQTTINTVSILLFLPFLSLFSNWLEQKFISDDSDRNTYMSEKRDVVPLLAAEALQLETKRLFEKTLAFNFSVFNKVNKKNNGLIGNIISFAHTTTSFEDEYQKLKKTEGDILHYYSSIQKNYISPEESQLMVHYVGASRQCVYAAKAIKDILHNLEGFNSSANNFLHMQCNVLQKEWINFEEKLQETYQKFSGDALNKQMELLLSESLNLEEFHKVNLINNLKKNKLNELETSTLMNVYREILSSKKSLIIAANYLGEEKLITENEKL